MALSIKVQASTAASSQTLCTRDYGPKGKFRIALKNQASKRPVTLTSGTTRVMDCGSVLNRVTISNQGRRVHLLVFLTNVQSTPSRGRLRRSDDVPTYPTLRQCTSPNMKATVRRPPDG